MSHHCIIILNMACLLETWSVVEVHTVIHFVHVKDVVIQFMHVKDVTPVEIHHPLEEVYGMHILSQKHM
jgi:hypothetical protein